MRSLTEIVRLNHKIHSDRK